MLLRRTMNYQQQQRPVIVPQKAIPPFCHAIFIILVNGMEVHVEEDVEVHVEESVVVVDQDEDVVLTRILVIVRIPLAAIMVLLQPYTKVQKIAMQEGPMKGEMGMVDLAEVIPGDAGVAFNDAALKVIVHVEYMIDEWNKTWE